MMPEAEEHLGGHSVIEPALGIGHGGECGEEEFSPSCPFLDGPFGITCLLGGFFSLKTYSFGK